MKRASFACAVLSALQVAVAADFPLTVIHETFEEADALRNWTQVGRGGFRIEEGAGLEGSRALVLEYASVRPVPEAGETVAVEGNAVVPLPQDGRETFSREVPVEPGRSYDFSVMLKGAITNNCAYLFFAWYDKDGKRLGMAGGTDAIYRKVGTAGWERFGTSTQRLPSETARAKVFLELYRTTLGRMEFDDLRVSASDVKHVDRMFSSAYRDAAADGKVRFLVPYVASPEFCPREKISAAFTFAGKDGAFTARAGTRDGRSVEVTVDVARLAEGRHPVTATLFCGERSLGTCKMDFTRADVPRKVRFDARKRLIVDGKPCLALGVYVHPADRELAYLDRLKDSPFNCVIECGPRKETLDKVHAAGLMALPRSPWQLAGARAVARELRDHPALLGWYTIDEAPVSSVPDKTEIYESFRELDPDHVVIGVLDYPRNSDAFLGTFDVLAPDPYPVGYKRVPLSSAADYPAECRERTHGLRPVWQVPQSFAWDWCHQHGHPEEDRYPTYKEMRAMSWMAIAGGANGLLWYSAHHIFKCSTPDTLEANWGSLVKVAREIRRHEAIILSDEEPPKAVSRSADIAVRAFRKDGRVWLLAVNKTTSPVKGAVSVEGFADVTFELPALGVKTHRFDSVNYDEGKVGSYALEDPLAFADGTPLKTAADWPRRRAEILGVFAREMYGQEPPRPEAVVCETFERGETLAGLAVREQVRMWFRPDRSGPSVDWLVLRPKFAKGPVPIVVQLNYYGNHDFLTDPEVVLPRGWVQNETLAGGIAITDHRVPEAMRGRLRRTDRASAFPVETIVARGYAFATACYADVSPDPDYLADDMEDLPYTGVFSLWGPRDPSRTDDVTALGAWAWALSRGLDLAAWHPALDARRSVVTGCSRLGKAALLAAARDERFAVCVPNQTGKGGVPLGKRDFGENVFREVEMFPHWFCKAYRKYVDREKSMAFDQHLLLACVAPRALLVQGFDRPWFDPRGEWLSCRAASPAWTFLGKPGLPDVPEPDCFSTAAVGPSLGYVRRKGQHGISGHDWQWMLDFADRILGK